MKKLIASLAIIGSACAFADIDDTSVIVSTKGPDAYADGTTVVDGEYYALCWSAGDFAGIKADCTLVNPDDAILGIFPAAKDGKCKLFKYVLKAADFKKGGNISLWLLDTRVYPEVGKPAPAKQESATKVSTVNGAAPVQASIDVSKVGFSDVNASVPVSLSSDSATAVPAGTPSPKIKSIKVTDTFVAVEVENTAPYITYALEAGDKPSELVKDESKAVTGKDGEIITIYADKSEKGFFKVGRK